MPDLPPPPPPGSVADISEACLDFLAYASDQSPHLRGGDYELAAYVGRRLDQAWRWLDFSSGLWVQERYQEEVNEEDRTADINAALSQASSLSWSSTNGDDLNLEAASHLDETARTVHEFTSRSQRRGLEVRDAAISMHLARRSFSAYRVAKYRWLEEALETGRYAPEAAYRWLEA